MDAHEFQTLCFLSAQVWDEAENSQTSCSASGQNGFSGIKLETVTGVNNTTRRHIIWQHKIAIANKLLCVCVCVDVSFLCLFCFGVFLWYFCTRQKASAIFRGFKIFFIGWKKQQTSALLENYCHVFYHVRSKNVYFFVSLTSDCKFQRNIYFLHTVECETEHKERNSSAS